MPENTELAPAAVRDWIARARYRPVLHRSRQNLIQARAQDNVPQQALALYGLASALAYPGRYRDARLLLDAAMDDARDNYLPELFAYIVNERGNLLMTGDMQPYSAQQHHEEALSLARNLNDFMNISIALTGLARVANHLEDHNDALAFAEEALSYAERLNHTLLEVQAHIQIGRAFTGKHRDVAAMECLHDALEMAHEAGYLSEQALIIHYGGLVLLRNQQGKEAIDHQSHALSVSDKLNYAYGKFRALDGLRMAHDSAGNLVKTREATDAMLLLAQRSEAPMYEASAHAGRAGMFFRREQYPQALDALANALELTQEHNNPIMEIKIMLRIAKTYEALHQYPQARQAYEAARSIQNALDNSNGADAIFWQIVWSYVQEFYDRVLRVTGFRRDE